MIYDAKLYWLKYKFSSFKHPIFKFYLTYLFGELKVLNCFYSKSKQAENLTFYTFHQNDVWSHDIKKSKVRRLWEDNKICNNKKFPIYFLNCIVTPKQSDRVFFKFLCPSQNICSLISIPRLDITVQTVTIRSPPSCLLANSWWATMGLGMQILQSATVAKVAAAALAYYTFEPPLENVTLNLLKVGDSAAVARRRRRPLLKVS